MYHQPTNQPNANHQPTNQPNTNHQPTTQPDDNQSQFNNQDYATPKPNNTGSKTLLTDLYQLTMNAAYQDNNKTSTATFDLFIRKTPENWGYLLAAGLEDVVDYIQNLRFDAEDIDYIRSLNLFTESYLDSLKHFKFTGDIAAVPEGTVVFPGEPIVRVTAPMMEAQLIESYLLNKINFQTMIATKASRVVYSANGSSVIDFGMRRAHDSDAAINGARSSYIGGFVATSNVLAGKLFGIPVKGTHAHSFVMSFDSELEAFRAYVKTFPNNATLLIDTYDTKQGVRNAAIVAKELEKQGKRLFAVRIDSDPLRENAFDVREILDKSGVGYVKIVASNDLNEYKISALKESNTPIDSFGVGTDNIVSRDCPALPGVYKLVEIIDREGNPVGKMKLSNGKQTLPGKKQVYRVCKDRNNRNDYTQSGNTPDRSKQGQFIEDIVGLEGERIRNATKLLVPIFSKGKLVYSLPSLESIRSHAKEQLSMLPDYAREIHATKRFPCKQSKRLSLLVSKIKTQHEVQQ